MRKLLLITACMGLATSVLAQEDLVKQAKKLNSDGKYAEAIEVLTPALTAGSNEEKASAWDLMSQIKYKMYSDIHQVAVESEIKKTDVPYDTTAMHKAFIESFEAALKCDEFDQMPNEKGKVKLEYRDANAKLYSQFRPLAIAAGQYEYERKNNGEALRYWKLYVDSSKSSLFTGIDMTKDEYRSEVAYYISFLSYNEKDFPQAVKYAQIAAENPEKVSDANEIILFAKRDGAKTKEDSVEYVNTLRDLHKKAPEDARYFNMLMDYYSKPGRQAEMASWLNEEINLNPNNKLTWALKGELAMKDSKWDDAIDAYKKSLEIDPDFIQVIFNLGVCMNSKAIELKDSLADKATGGLSAANAEKVKAILREAMPYLEKTKAMDPERKTVNWAYPLYQIYYSLGDKEKTAEMEKFLNNN